MRPQDIPEEPLLPDVRVERLADKLRSEFGRRALQDAEFATFVVPARHVNIATDSGVAVPTWIPEMAVFAILLPNPRRPGQKLMTHATASLADWISAESEWAHYVGRPDPAHGIFRGVVREALRIQNDLRQLIN